MFEKPEKFLTTEQKSVLTNLFSDGAKDVEDILYGLGELFFHIYYTVVALQIF